MSRFRRCSLRLLVLAANSLNPGGNTTVRASTQQPRLYVGMVLILIFAEVLGLYGVVVSIMMLTSATNNVTECLY